MIRARLVQTPAQRLLRLLLLSWLIVLLPFLLLGCGGSTCEEEDVPQQIPANPLCQEHPERCR